MTQNESSDRGRASKLYDLSMTRLAATQRCVSFEVKGLGEGQRWDGNPKFSTLLKEEEGQRWKGIAALIDSLLLLLLLLLFFKLYYISGENRLLYTHSLSHTLANSTKQETSTRVRQQRHPGTGGTSATHAKETDKRGASAAQIRSEFRRCPGWSVTLVTTAPWGVTPWDT